MIRLTLFDGRTVLVNADLLESIEQTPDTIVSFASGHKLLVRDTPEQIAQQMLNSKRAVHRDEPLRDTARVLAGDHAGWRRP